jgi:hypothetical protein
VPVGTQTRTSTLKLNPEHSVQFLQALEQSGRDITATLKLKRTTKNKCPGCRDRGGHVAFEFVKHTCCEEGVRDDLTASQRETGTQFHARTPEKALDLID